MKQDIQDKERGLLLIAVSILCFLEADLAELMPAARQHLHLGQECQPIECVVMGYHLLGIGHFERNELEAAREIGILS